jgi:hypothetical protein
MTHIMCNPQKRTFFILVPLIPLTMISPLTKGFWGKKGSTIFQNLQKIIITYVK